MTDTSTAYIEADDADHVTVSAHYETCLAVNVVLGHHHVPQGDAGEDQTNHVLGALY